MIMRLGIRRFLTMAVGSAILGAGLACFSDRGTVTAPNGAQCAIPLDPNLLGSTVIAIKDLAYLPAQVTVKAGTKVTWANCDVANGDHTSTSGTGVFDSGIMSAGPPAGIFSFTFPQAGAFGYICTVHPSMQGTVLVQ
jgi:plastocyanin